jgi:hypothetical protein
VKPSQKMKRNFVTLLAALGVGAGVPSARAQQAGDSGATEVRSELQTPERQGDRSGSHRKPDRPDRPERSDTKRPDKEVVRQLVDSFRAQAEDYKKQQQELTRKLKDATDEDRARIRDEIKQLRDNFQEAKDQFRDQIKEQSDKLNSELIRKIKDEKPDKHDRKDK